MLLKPEINASDKNRRKALDKDFIKGTTVKVRKTTAYIKDKEYVSQIKTPRSSLNMLKGVAEEHQAQASLLLYLIKTRWLLL